MGVVPHDVGFGGDVSVRNNQGGGLLNQRMLVDSHLRWSAVAFSLGATPRSGVWLASEV